MKTSLSNSYIPKFSVESYLAYMSNNFPELFKTFWFDRPDAFKIIDKMNQNTTDFEGSRKGGRGDSYRKAQVNSSVRIVGIKQLIQFAINNHDTQNLPASYKILDVLGGDGILARAFSSIQSQNNPKLLILTSDIAGDMISQAFNYGLPAIRQPAHYLLLKDNSYDAVIIAYGTHHIPEEERASACKEALRILRPGGRIVIHDFEENSCMSKWFNDVVNKYSTTGHKYKHFTIDKLQYYLKKGGFKNIKITHMYDPFIMRDAKKNRAYSKLMNYVLNMYGLEQLKKGSNSRDTQEKVYNLIKKYIIYNFDDVKEAKPHWKKALSFSKENGEFVAEMPRIALVGIGTK